MIDFPRIAADALASADSLLNSWLPGGKRNGVEYVCAGLSGGKGGSLSVNTRTGVWADFSGDAKGGDLISLLAAIRGCSQADAARELASLPPPGPRITIAPAEEWTAQPFAPAGSPEPRPVHPKFGTPALAWTYRTAAGEVIGLVCRFNLADGGKEVLPFSWCRNGAGESRWKWKAFAKPRPMYGLDRLAANPGAEVLVVEGEKTADAAQRLMGESCVCVTWPGGSKAVGMVDWTPLAGRRVMVWPDNDAPGLAAAVSVPDAELITPPPNKPAGWDLADAEAEGWTVQWVRAHIANVRASRPPAVPEPEHTPDAAEVAATFPEHAHGDAPAVATLDQPFRILGHDCGSFYYMPRGAKQVVALTANEHKHLQLLQLAPDAWWNSIFAAKDGCDWKAAANYLVQKSYAQGIYSPRRIRGRGAWMDGENVVLHTGDRLFVNGVPSDLATFESRFIYEHGQPLEHVDSEPLSDLDAAKLAQLCDLLPWRHSIHGLFLTGWAVVAPICGVLAWRPHIWISGPSGSGKTWVVTNIIEPLVGKTALQVQSATTEAGIRQALRSDALPVIFDEAESEDKSGQSRMQRTLELARQASSETGAGIIKGTAGGRAMEFCVRSCFVFASIGVAAIQRADTSRITPLELAKRGGATGAAAFADLKALWADSLGQPGYSDALRARALSMARTIRVNSQTLARAVAAKLGDQRVGDQLGALLAGAFAVTTDKVFTDEEAARRVESLDWTPFLPDSTDTDEVQALNVLVDSHIRVDDGQGAHTASVGELIARARSNLAPVITEAAEATLLRHGIKLDSEWLTVSNSHHSLRRMFADTPWAGKWKDQLGRVKGAEHMGATSFGAGKHRAVRLPIESVI